MKSDSANRDGSRVRIQSPLRFLNALEDLIRGCNAQQFAAELAVAQYPAQSRKNLQMLRHVGRYEQEKQPHRCAVKRAVWNPAGMPPKNDLRPCDARDRVSGMWHRHGVSEAGAAKSLPAQKRK